MLFLDYSFVLFSFNIAPSIVENKEKYLFNHSETLLQHETKMYKWPEKHKSICVHGRMDQILHHIAEDCSRTSREHIEGV